MSRVRGPSFAPNNYPGDVAEYGLLRSPAKTVCSKMHRGFKSLRRFDGSNKIIFEPCYNIVMAKYKEDILRLREEGKSYREIESQLGCSKGTIAYHLGEGQKEKTLNRNAKNPRPNGRFKAKVDRWLAESPVPERQTKGMHRSHKRRIQDKIGTFHRNKTVREDRQYTYDEVMEFIKDYENCYLTGRPVDINDCSTFHFDHIEPRSRGGSNDLDNLGVVTPEANYAKRDLPLEDFLELCVDVVTHWGFFDPEDMK